MREAVVPLVISHGDGAEADPQLELEVVLIGDLATPAWRALTVLRHSVPPSLCIDGPPGPTTPTPPAGPRGPVGPPPGGGGGGGRGGGRGGAARPSRGRGGGGRVGVRGLRPP